MRLSDFIEQSNLSESPEALLGLMERAVGDIGFDRYAFCALTRHERYKVSDSPAPAVALNYPSSWTDYYFDRNYQTKDPVLLYAPELEQPFLWSWLAKTARLDRAQTTIMREASEAGLLDGVGVPLHGSRGNLCLLTCASAEGHSGPESTFSDLVALATQFHLVYRELCRKEPECLVVPLLTERERACLQWILQGKSSWEVGAVLHISENTVNYHLKKAFEKLDVKNRIDAVVTSIRFGLISL